MAPLAASRHKSLGTPGLGAGLPRPRMLLYTPLKRGYVVLEVKTTLVVVTRASVCSVFIRCSMQTAFQRALGSLR